MFCPACGKKTEELIDNVCFSCFLRNLNTNEIEIYECKSCGKLFLKKNILYKKDLERFLERIIKKDIIIKELKKEDDKLNIILNINKKLVVTSVDIKGKITCSKCGYVPKRKRILLQLRGTPQKVLETLNALFRENYKIVEVVEKREGLDVYLDESLISIRKLLKKIKTNKDVEIKMTRKLITFDRLRSKKVYRLKILIKFTNYK